MRSTGSGGDRGLERGSVEDETRSVQRLKGHRPPVDLTREHRCVAVALEGDCHARPFLDAFGALVGGRRHLAVELQAVTAAEVVPLAAVRQEETLQEYHHDPRLPNGPPVAVEGCMASRTPRRAC